MTPEEKARIEELLKKKAMQKDTSKRHTRSHKKKVTTSAHIVWSNGFKVEIPKLCIDGSLSTTLERLAQSAEAGAFAILFLLEAMKQLKPESRTSLIRAGSNLNKMMQNLLSDIEIRTALTKNHMDAQSENASTPGEPQKSASTTNEGISSEIT